MCIIYTKGVALSDIDKMPMSTATNGLYKELLLMLRRVYQHEQCPVLLKTYIKFEMKRYFKPDIDISGFLEGD
jgi:hypothetical protein